MFECETLLPTLGRFPVKGHTRAMSDSVQLGFVEYSPGPKGPSVVPGTVITLVWRGRQGQSDAFEACRPDESWHDGNELELVWTHLVHFV